MKELFKYIEFLLPKHGCVVVPGLGGFIVDVGSGIEFCTPFETAHSSVVFNAELVHNDGLLATVLHDTYNITYKQANEQIAKEVKYVKEYLILNKALECGNLGALVLTDSNNLIFSPNISYQLPSLWGLSRVKLRTLSDISILSTKDKSRNRIRRIAISAVSVAAAVSFFILPSYNVGGEKGNSSRNNIQSAGFVQSMATYLPDTERNDAVSILDSQVENIDKVSTSKLAVNPSHKTTSDSSIGAPSINSYYLIIGGEDNKNQAEKLLLKYKQTDFPEAKIVESHNKFRIYVAAFSDKEQADQFVLKFRTQNPKYASAWIFHK